ncbi:hypothetical protein [Nitrosomonas sp.]|uniref:hypothetical protein n=1 Tax=Nitrosomonas sp. TaxID=42353 RepID=UPI0025FCC0E8|nr:hypothetical protein [Nitrosomonas sp.]
MMNSIYKVLTPAGQFDAIFAEDEDIPIEYSGDELAISFFKDWLFINQVSGEHGHLLDSKNLTPRELYGFCQPRGGVIEVIPPFEDFLAYIQEDAANPVEDNDEQLQEENTMQANDMVNNDSSLDGVYTDADKEAIAATNQLIKYFRDFIASDFEKAKVPTSIYGWTATGQVMNKDEAKRMLRSLIDVAINRKAGIEDITPKQQQRIIDFQSDARVISDYLTKRIRHTGARNLLRTPEMKAKFPEIDNQPRDEFDSAITNDEVKNIGDVTLDNISGIEKIKLIKEAGSLRSSLQSAQSGMEKLKMVKRIKEIRDALGVGAGGLDKDGLDSDGMWPMTKAEYDKIHSDYKGAFPDGTPTALKLINGASSIVPVRITDEQPKDPEPEVKPQATIEDVNKVMLLLKQFIGAAQLSAIGSVIRGEEGQFFKDKLIEIANVIQTMPKTWETDGQGDKAIAYLHYFKGSGDWHITEKDMEDEQLQAFGLANIGYGGELGYISIEELIGAGVELDLYWTPKTIGAIKGVSSEDESEGTETGGDETGGESTEIPQSTEEPQTIMPADTIRAGFIAELESLKTETDINRFNERLDEIAARIEQAGLMETLDKELNDAADVLTALLAAAEKVS